MKMYEIFRISESIVRAYHGTARRFTVFADQKPRHLASYRLGFYFSKNPKYAETYATSRKGPSPRIIEADLTLRNPFDIFGMSAQDVITELPLPKRAKQELNSAFRGKSYSQYGLLEAGVRFGLRDALIAQGFDSIIYEEGYAHAYIIFDSDQIAIVGERSFPKPHQRVSK